MNLIWLQNTDTSIALLLHIFFFFLLLVRCYSTMVMQAVTRNPLLIASHKLISASVATTRRTLTSSQRPNSLQIPRAPINSNLPRSNLQQSFRRSYADAVSPKTKRRGRGFFRWTWRLTYLSAIGGVGYLAYNIYSLRTPHEQFEPDPSKKTLVILGMLYRLKLNWHSLTV